MKPVPENICLKTCSISVLGAQSTSLSSLNSLQGMSQVCTCRAEAGADALLVVQLLADALGRSHFLVDILFGDGGLVAHGGGGGGEYLSKWCGRKKMHHIQVRSWVGGAVDGLG